ncbi:MAG: PAS-domain containing protein, partial [Pseudomonadota bacterium]
MKHVHETDLKDDVEAASDPFSAWCGGADVAERLRDDRDRALLQAVVDMMEQGVVFWDKKGVAELVSADAPELLELGDFSLVRGVKRASLLKELERRGRESDFSAGEAEAIYKSGEPFRATRDTPGGRKILIQGRPRPCGGHVVTLSDVTVF